MDLFASRTRIPRHSSAPEDLKYYNMFPSPIFIFWAIFRQSEHLKLPNTRIDSERAKVCRVEVSTTYKSFRNQILSVPDCISALFKFVTFKIYSWISKTSVKCILSNFTVNLLELRCSVFYMFSVFLTLKTFSRIWLFYSQSNFIPQPLFPGPTITIEM